MSERDSWPEAPSLEDPPGDEDEAPEAEIETPEPEVESSELQPFQGSEPTTGLRRQRQRNLARTRFEQAIGKLEIGCGGPPLRASPSAR